MSNAHDVNESKYPQVVKFISSTPWAILPEKLTAILDLVEFRVAGGKLTTEQIEARIGAAPTQRQASRAGAVAVIPLFGTIVPRADLFTEMSGGTSAQGFGAAITAAAANPDVSAILIDVDSPGGSVSLIPETADLVAEARASKPVVAIANTMMASAAYWLASQADEIVVTPSGMVGSIGVLAAHHDQSGRMEQLGVNVSLVSAGKFKTEGNPFEPLTEEARADLQSLVDTYYGMFTAAVAEGRGVTPAAVRGGFGEGRVVTAEDAVRLGMADRVDTFEATIDRLLSQTSGSSGQARAQGGTIPVMVSRGESILNRAQQEALARGGPPPSDDSTITDDPEAAVSGLSFVREAIAARDAAIALETRARSLAEVRRGRLTAAKRDALIDATAAIQAAATSLGDLVAATDPGPKPEDTARAAYERQRFAHLDEGAVAR